ncbi:MAG: Ig-like domain-containing protein, partial [Gemmatimonadaceae bacterium]
MRLPLSWVVGRTVAAVVLLLAVNSCDTPLETETNGVDRVVVTPTSGSVEVGATLTLNALVLDESGNALRDRKVVWSSQNPAIATVSQSGVVQGVAAGTVNVAASSGGKSASAAITVTARPVTLVRVTPGSATIAVGASTTLQAEALDASGARVLGKTVFWTSSSDAIAVVSANGVVAGISPGSVTISATVDSRTGTAAITVSPQPVASVVISPRADTISVGERVTLQATPLDARGLPLTGRIIVWTSLNPAVATVSSVGEVLGLAVGNARIRATVEGRTAEASLDVRPVPVSQVVVTPAQVTLAPGQTSQLTVTLSDSAGNVLSGRTVTYASNNVAVATVSSSGLITAVAEGAAQIVVTSEGKTASALVTVTPVPVA